MYIFLSFKDESKTLKVGRVTYWNAVTLHWNVTQLNYSVASVKVTGKLL